MFMFDKKQNICLGKLFAFVCVCLCLGFGSSLLIEDDAYAATVPSDLNGIAASPIDTRALVEDGYYLVWDTDAQKRSTNSLCKRENAPEIVGRSGCTFKDLGLFSEVRGGGWGHVVNDAWHWYCESKPCIELNWVGLKNDEEYGYDMREYAFVTTGDVGSAANGAWFTLKYKKAAKLVQAGKSSNYKWIDIVVKSTFKTTVRNSTNETDKAIVQFTNIFDYGFFMFNSKYLDQEFTFYEAGTDDVIPIKGKSLYVSRTSMDKGEGLGVSSGVSSMVSNNAAVINRKFSSLSGYTTKVEQQWSAVPGSYVYEISDRDAADDEDETFFGYLGIPGIRTLPGGPPEYTDSKDRDNGTYWWRSATIEAVPKSNTIKVRSYSVGTKNWPYNTTIGSDSKASPKLDADMIDKGAYINVGNSFFTVAFQPMVPPVPDRPRKYVDKETCLPNDVLTYTVNQKVTNRNLETIKPDFCYASMVFSDELPPDTKYVANSFTVKVGGVDVTDQAGRVVSNSDGSVVKYIFNASYLRNSMEYRGETYTFGFKAKVNSAIEESVIKNQGITTINGDYELKTNWVKTVYPQARFTPTITKELTGAKLKDKQFTFELLDSSGTVIDTAKNDAKGNVKFSTIEYDTTGTHTYKIREKNTPDTIECTPEEITVTVRVTGDGDALIATPKYSDDGTFENQFVVKVTPEVQKILAGRDLSANEFTFKIWKTTGLGGDRKGSVLDTKKNAADGLVTFDEQTFTKAGTYWYRIEEVVPSDTGSIIYDKDIIYLRVVVTANDNGELKAAKDYFKDAGEERVNANPRKTEFVNVDGVEGTWKPEVHKVLKSDTPLQAGQFTFELKGAALESTQRATNNANGVVKFNTGWHVMLPKDSPPVTRKFTIREIAGNDPDLRYDRHVYTVSVTAKVDGDTVKFTEKKVGSDTFTNRKKVIVKWGPTVTKKTLGYELGNKKYNYELLDADGHRVGSIQQNDANGKVEFPKMEFTVEPDEDDIQTFKYRVREIAGDDNLLTYDSHECTFVLTLKYDASIDDVVQTVDIYDEELTRKLYRLFPDGNWGDTPDPTIFTNIAPPPAPTKDVDKNWAEVGDEVNYKVLQTSYDGYVYKNLVFEDTLPDGLSYKAKSFHVEDGHGQDVTDEAGKLTVSGNSLKYVFDASWLKNAWKPGDKWLPDHWYVTDRLTFYFTGVVKDEAAPSVQQNRAKTTTNGDLEQWTDWVETKVPAWYISVTKTSNGALDALHNTYKATYSLRDTKDDPQANLIAQMSTDEHGFAKQRVVHAGTYTVREDLPPMGHRASNQVETFKLNKDNATTTASQANTYISKALSYENESIPYNPTKKVDKDYAETGEVLTYTVEQEISTVQVTAMKFTDKIPDKTTYVPNSLEVVDPTGNIITHVAGKTTMGTDGRTLTYTFNESWLDDLHGYDVNKAKFKFTFKVTINEEAAGDRIENQGTIRINESDLKTNTVTTDVPKWIIKIVKTSDGTLDTLHKVSGAEYEVYDDATMVYGRLTTGDNGQQTLELHHPGTYRIREVTPPAGHRISDKIETVVLNEDNDLLKGAAATAVSETVTYENESIPYQPVKEVDSTYSTSGKVLTYTVTQEIPSMGLSTAVFKDMLPANTEYVDGSFVVIDGDGDNVTYNAGVLTLVPSTVDGVARMTLNYSFKASYLAQPSGYEGHVYKFKFQVRILDAAAPSTLRNTADIILNNHTFTSNPVETKVPVWYVTVVKKTDYPNIIEGNSLYSLAGAVFEVRDANDRLVGTLESDSNGLTGKVKLTEEGKYKVVEVVPPLGHEPAVPDYQEFEAKRSEDGKTYTITFTNKSIVGYFDYIAMKVDRDYYFGSIMGEDSTHLPGTNWWQGNETDFSKTRVLVEFFGPNKYTGQPMASATFGADAQGRIAFRQATPLSGTWPYKKGDDNVMPLGYVRITETTAPDGYNLDNTPHCLRLVQDKYSYKLVPGSNCRLIDANEMFG